MRSGDLGMAFLYGKNTMEEGIYIWLTYRPETKEIILKLGSSWTHDSKLSLEKKNEFNMKYMKQYKDNLDYKLIIKNIQELLDVFLKSEVLKKYKN